MMSKGITLLAQKRTFNYDIREWGWKPADLKTWTKYKLFFHWAHWEQKIVATTVGKGGYTATVQNIYSAPPPFPEEHHEVIKDIQKLCRECEHKDTRWKYWHKKYSPCQLELRGNGTVGTDEFDHESHACATEKTRLSTKKTSETKRKFYCWSCWRNFTHGSKTCSAKKSVHQEEAYYKKWWVAVKRDANDC